MEQKEFDEFYAVEYIRSHMAKNLSEKYDDDDLLLLIDAIGDFLSSHSGNDAADKAVVEYVKSQLKKDAENVIEMADVESLVLAELDYEDTLE